MLIKRCLILVVLRLFNCVCPDDRMDKSIRHMIKCTMNKLLAFLAAASLLAESSPGAIGQNLLAGSQEGLAFSLFQVQTNKEMRLRLTGPKAVSYRIDASADLASWTPLIALTNATGNAEHIDTAAPLLGSRYYRAEQLAGALFTGDYLPTTDGDLIIHPIFHAAMVMTWKNLTICVDPTSDTLSQYAGLPRADLMLVTHEHSDHYDANAINAIALAS